MTDWTQAKVTEKVIQILQEGLLKASEPITPQSNLIERGLDSLSFTQLMLALEECTGVWVDESLLTEENLRSPETLAAVVYRAIASA